jgi:hypothetical protein
VPANLAPLQTVYFGGGVGGQNHRGETCVQEIFGRKASLIVLYASADYIITFSLGAVGLEVATCVVQGMEFCREASNTEVMYGSKGACGSGHPFTQVYPSKVGVQDLCCSSFVLSMLAT